MSPRLRRLISEFDGLPTPSIDALKYARAVLRQQRSRKRLLKLQRAMLHLLDGEIEGGTQADLAKRLLAAATAYRRALERIQS